MLPTWTRYSCYPSVHRNKISALIDSGLYHLLYEQRRTKDAAEDFAKRHGVPRFYTDVDELLRDPEVDAVYIATPPGSHKDLALRACAAGKPCYVEKPMARLALF